MVRGRVGGSFINRRILVELLGKPCYIISESPAYARRIYARSVCLKTVGTRALTVGRTVVTARTSLPCLCKAIGCPHPVYTTISLNVPEGAMVLLLSQR